MIINELLDLVNKDKRRKEREKTAMKVAIGVGVAATIGVATGILISPKSGKETREELKLKVVNAVEAIQKNAETVKKSVGHAVENATNAIKDVQGKVETIKNDFNDGRNEVTQEIQKTAVKISNEINK